MRSYINNQKEWSNSDLDYLMGHHYKGILQSGTGRGAMFIALPIYHDIFEIHLNDTPFPGTLNLKLNAEGAKAVNTRFETGKVYDDLTYKGESFGGIVIIPISISKGDQTLDVVAVRPHLTSHTSDIVELVSGKHLRSTLKLKDGNEVSIALRS